MLNFYSASNVIYKPLHIFRVVYLLFIILCFALIYLAANTELERIKLDAGADFSSKVQHLETTIEHLETMASVISNSMSHHVDYSPKESAIDIDELFDKENPLHTLKYIDDSYKSGLYVSSPLLKEQQNKLKVLLRTGSYLPHLLQEEKLEQIAIYFQNPEAKLVYPAADKNSPARFLQEQQSGYWQSFWDIHQHNTFHWKLIKIENSLKLSLTVSILEPNEGLMGLVQFIFSHEIFDPEINQANGPDSLVFLSEIAYPNLLVATTEDDESSFIKKFSMQEGENLPSEIQLLLNSINSWVYQSDQYFLLSVPIAQAFNLVYLTDVKGLQVLSLTIFKYGIALLVFLILIGVYVDRVIYQNLATLKEQDDALTDKNKLLTSTLSSLESTQQELIQKEKIASLSSVVAGLAHQLNTPLSIAVTATSFISESTERITNKFNQGLKKSELETFLKDTYKSSQLVDGNLERASCLVDNFKLLASNESEDELCLFDVVEYTHAILQGFRPTFEQRRIKSNIESALDIKIYSYPTSYTQILVQLINNILTHGIESEGCITVNITKNAALNQIKVDVIDDGKGIEKGKIDRIFEPFFTSKPKIEQTGLGLTIIHNLVLGKMLGEIKVASEQGEGCCFSLTLPSIIHKN